MEINQIFNMIDVNDKDLIEKEDYHKFYNLFVKKFLICDPEDKFIIEYSKVKACIDSLFPQQSYLNDNQIAQVLFFLRR